MCLLDALSAAAGWVSQVSADKGGGDWPWCAFNSPRSGLFSGVVSDLAGTPREQRYVENQLSQRLFHALLQSSCLGSSEHRSSQTLCAWGLYYCCIVEEKYCTYTLPLLTIMRQALNSSVLYVSLPFCTWAPFVSPALNASLCCL